MDENSVSFKGTVNGLTIILRSDVDFEEVVKNLRFKIETAGKFFKGAKLAVKYKGRKLNDDERTALLDILIKESGAEILSFNEDTEDPSAKAINSTPAPERNNQLKKYMFFKGIDEGMTKFYRGTVRSGQLVSFNGNVVILGDVNPGGVVEATGNVIIMGLLRGIVHAGSDGNKEAIIAAMGLHPTQLRIGDIITRSPDEKVESEFIPELAYVKDDKVYIERFLPQR